MQSKNAILVTVIMPVYNAAEYLEQTLLSVLGTQETDVELIAVDDGSSDESLSILNEYEKRFSNLHVYTQKNSGPSAARNKGLSYARGQFVFFLDSDDLLEISVLKKMCEKANRKFADLVIAEYDIFNEFRTFKVPLMKKLSTMDKISWKTREILWTFSLCNKVFRRSKIEELNLRFSKTNYSEDGVFVMNFVYWAAKIIGYEGVVFHYRRMTVAEHKSITSAVSEKKVKDYLLSHDMIYELMVKKFLEENVKYQDFEQLKEENREVNDYINEFLKKEISILFNQFYKLFWTLEENLIGIIVQNIERLLKKVDVKTYYEIAGRMPELILKNLPTTYEQARNEANISVLLYGNIEQENSFMESLTSLLLQRYVPYKIYVPQYFRHVIEKESQVRHQLVYVDANNMEQFYNVVLRQVDSEYVLLGDIHFTYDKSALLELYKMIEKMNLDFITATIYLKNDDQTFPSSAHGRNLLSVKNYRNGKKALKMDEITGNKLIRTQYLKTVCQKYDCFKLIPEKIYRQGYFAITEKCYVIFNNGGEEDFVKYVSSKRLKVEEDDIKDIRLDDSRFLVNQIELYKKLRTSNLKKDEWKRRFIYKVSQLPVENRVLFFSIRRDDELDDNLECVAAQINNNKIIATKKLPHDNLYKLKMYYYIATSKVIVTDDYVRYLRLFPLKKEQRVIQLWHACGAFKKFGLQGTTLSLGLERATHIQYNLVSVSAEGIRQTYANAFDIDVSNIVALGVPRTDLFFNEIEKEKRKERIYETYPEWKDKEIILYAPTFRDKTGDRTHFQPELDFKKLSKKLRKNQIFVIAPHPVMKNTIVKENFNNIYEIRDIHTLDLMFVSDLLVTDYSSVIFEYALLRKPIIFFCYDLELYDRGFYLPYDESLPGKIAESQEKLIEYLIADNRNNLGETYDMFVEKYMGACDGKSTERIVALIEAYL